MGTTKTSTVETLKADIECTRPEDLRLIYEQQMEFARLHNALVWQVSSIFIPFSFAGLALNFQTTDQVQAVGYASITIIVFWTLLAEWHRWVWVHSFYIAGVIENLLGIRSEPPSKPSFWNLGPPQFVGMSISWAPVDFGRILRLAFGFAGVAFWLWRMERWD